MYDTRLALITLSACSVLLAACSNGGSSQTPPTRDTPVVANRCTDPRPEICTQQYIGVCATLADGSSRTHATGCTACADPKVIGWGPGECE